MLKLLVTVLTLFSVCSACTIYSLGISAAASEYVLNYHNDLRKSIANGSVPGQPRGINLKRLEWDSQLEKAAEGIASQCNTEPGSICDLRFNVSINFYNVLAADQGSQDALWERTIKLWFDEYKDYTYPVADNNTMNYRQIVWAETQYVGCSFVLYTDGGFYNGNCNYICAYGPGATLDEAPYETGDSGCEDLC